MVDTPSHERQSALRRGVERLRELPTLPAVVQRVTAVLDRPDADLAEAAAVIESDRC